METIWWTFSNLYSKGAKIIEEFSNYLRAISSSFGSPQTTFGISYSINIRIVQIQFKDPFHFPPQAMNSKQPPSIRNYLFSLNFEEFFFAKKIHIHLYILAAMTWNECLVIRRGRFDFAILLYFASWSRRALAVYTRCIARRPNLPRRGMQHLCNGRVLRRNGLVTDALPDANAICRNVVDAFSAILLRRRTRQEYVTYSMLSQNYLAQNNKK